VALAWIYSNHSYSKNIIFKRSVAKRQTILFTFGDVRLRFNISRFENFAPPE